MLTPLLLAAMPLCTAAQLRVTTDSRTGDFNGMSHSGAYLSVRNTSRRACRITASPRVTFVDRAARPLPTHARPASRSPGPTAPLTLAPGISARASLRWVSGPVYDRSRCLDAARVALTFGSAVVGAPLRAHLCGPHAGPVEVEQSPLERTSS